MYWNLPFWIWIRSNISCQYWLEIIHYCNIIHYLILTAIISDSVYLLTISYIDRSIVITTWNSLWDWFPYACFHIQDWLLILYYIAIKHPIATGCNRSNHNMKLCVGFPYVCFHIQDWLLTTCIKYTHSNDNYCFVVIIDITYGFFDYTKLMYNTNTIARPIIIYTPHKQAMYSL